MKKLNIVFAILILLGMSISSQPVKAQSGVSVSFQYFYDNLSPYGTWISYPQYGYVWQPRVSSGFHPYRTNGHWVWSNEYQWIWVSGYEWGWAPFHYGRWYYDSFYGWVWIPDYEWAPAWVVWRGSHDYYGWAPLGPGISINLGFGSYSPPYSYWSFVPVRYITSPVIYNYYVSPQQNTTIINSTSIFTNYSTSGGPANNVFVSGPQKTEVERYTNRSLGSVSLNETSKPVRTRATKSDVAIYKPKVSAADKQSAKPSRVITTDKPKKVTEPQRTQPVRTKPQKDQPVKTEPQRKQPVRTQPQRNEPVRNERQKTEPVRIQPQKNQPVRREPQRTQPVRTQPQRNQPVRNEPQRTQPVRTQPQRNQPVRNEPQRTQPVRTQPQQKPVKNEPQRSQPQRTEPPKNPPAQSQPNKKGKG